MTRQPIGMYRGARQNVQTVHPTSDKSNGNIFKQRCVLSYSAIFYSFWCERTVKSLTLHTFRKTSLFLPFSDTVMGSPCLRPEMQSESMELVLDEAFLDQLRDQFCSQLQVML